MSIAVEQYLTGIGAAKATQGGNFFLAGRHRVQILKFFSDFNKDKRPMILVESVIKESSNAASPPGTLGTQIIMLDKRPAAGNLKNFLLAAYNTTEEQIAAHAAQWAAQNRRHPDEFWQFMVAASLSPQQPLANKILEVVCTMRLNREKTHEYTLHDWKQPGTEPIALVAAPPPLLAPVQHQQWQQPAPQWQQPPPGAFGPPPGAPTFGPQPSAWPQPQPAPQTAPWPQTAPGGWPPR